MRTDLYTRTLRDVDATLPADGEVLAWDVDLGKYVPTGVDALVTPAPEVDLTDIVILDHTANAFRVREGSNNYIHVNTTNGSEAITLGNATTNPDLVWLGSGPWSVGGGSGTAGQILTSNGASASPTWQDAPDTFDPENVLIDSASATALRVHDGTSNWLLCDTLGGTIELGNATDNPDVELLGEGAFIMLGRFAVDSNYTYSVLPLLLGRGPSAATPQDGTILVEGGSGTDVAGATLHYYAGVATGDAESGTHAFYNSVRGTSGTAAQDSRPNNIFAGDRRLLRTHGSGNDTATLRHQSTNEATFHAVHTQEWEAVEDPPIPPPTLVGTITFPDDFTGTLRGHLNFINNYVGYDDAEAEYVFGTLSGSALLMALISEGSPVLLGVNDLEIDSVTYRTLPYTQEELLGLDATGNTLLLARSTAAGTIDLYAIGGSGTVDGNEIDGNVLIDARWHALEYTITEGGGTPPTITSFTVDVTGAGSPGGTASCRGGVDTLDFAWTATGDPTITYSIDQGVGTVSGGSETGVASVEGVTVYTLTATNSAGSDTATVTVTGVRQAITRYTWFRSYYSSDLSGTDLPAREAGFDTLTAKGSNATTGVTTAGLTSLALPAALVNAAVEPATATSAEGYGDSATHGNGNQFPTSTSRWHSRLLVRPTNLTNARFFWQMYFNGSNFISVQCVSSGTALRVSGSRTAGGFTADSAGALANDTWHIIDITYSNNEGPSAQAELRVYVNGALTATWNGAAGAFASFDATTTLFGLMGTRTGLTTQQGRYSFWGVRSLDSINDFTLADHQADAAALGLYTP